MPDHPLISICVCTFRRPEGLARLLAHLRDIERPSGCDLELLVVDNDAGASGREPFEVGTRDWAWPARYIVEPRSGVGFARTRCIEEARGEWIAYIDDDEWPEAGWLAALWEARLASAADGVFGPVLASFEASLPDWLAHSGFYERQRHPTGQKMHWSNCASGNVLFRRQLFFDVGGFDPAFSQSGSEDTDFFWRCLERGANFVWCDEAVAHEGVPAQRLTRAYVSRRAYIAGQNYTRLHAHRRGWPAYVHFFLRGLVIVALYGPLAWGARLLQHPATFRYEGKLQGGLGKMLAAWAPVSREYGAGSSQPPDSRG
ncbi:MAG: glycosyltransferase family 2 protein [Pelomonas sp.]|nr:glycosyltransferase family 2 protein [Roseateles sp.]